MQSIDPIFMKEALKGAKEAEKLGEIPVGAVLVRENHVIARAFNEKEGRKNSTAHAEILLLQEASLKMMDWRLKSCTVYVTLEPCPMCAGALVQARIKRLVYGCSDPKAGACHSLYQITEDPRLNHQVQVSSGVLEEECRQILKNFFKDKRRKN